MNVSHFDRAVIGSSPLSLAYAAMAAKAGYSVCVIEKAAQLGGAWAVDDVLAMSSIETSPHVFLPNQGAYETLDSMLDAGFTPLPIEPELHWMKRGTLTTRASARIANFKKYKLILALATLEGLSLRRPKNFFRRLARVANMIPPREWIGADVRTVMYPKGGLQGMFHRAENKLRDLGIAVLTKSEAGDILVSAQGASIRVRSGGNITSDRVLLSRHSDLASIRRDSGDVVLKTFTSSSMHYVFTVRGAAPRGFIQFCGDSPLVFVNDVTDYVPDGKLEEQEKRLFCARASLGQNLSIEEVESVLKRIGYLPTKAEITDRHSEMRHVKRISPASIKLVKKQCSPMIDFLLADDLSLMDSIAALPAVSVN